MRAILMHAVAYFAASLSIAGNQGAYPRASTAIAIKTPIEQAAAISPRLIANVKKDLHFRSPDAMGERRIARL